MTLLSPPRHMYHVGCGSITQYLRDIGGGGVCDGIQALESHISLPTSAQYNSKGELFIIAANRIRKVDVNGIISTIAGNGIAGYNGDGINATLATLNDPFQLLINSRDEIIFSDTRNYRVRKILNNGTIVTIAGNGKSFPFSENVDATKTGLNNPHGIALKSNGELYISDSYSGKIRKLSKSGIISTFASPLKAPYTLAFTASDAMYLTECLDLNGDCNLGTVAANDGQVTRLTGSTPFASDCLHSIDCYVADGGGMAVSNNGTGDLYYADNRRIRRLFKNGTIATVCGTSSYRTFNGENIDASLAQIDPLGLFITPQNEIIFTDVTNHRVRKINKFGKVQTIAGSGSGQGTYSLCGDGILQASSVPLIGPNGIVVTSKGEIIFSDWGGYFGHVIRKIDKNGIISTIAGTVTIGFNGDGLAANLTSLNGPLGMFITSNDEIVFADSNNNRVRKMLTNGTIITIAGTGQTTIIPEPVLATDANLNNPTDVAITLEGEHLIADSLNHRIVKILTNGSLITIAGSTSGIYGKGDDGILAIDSLLRKPSGVAVNSKGEIFIAEVENHRIRKILTNGTIITIAGTGFMGNGADNVLATKSKLDSPSKVILDEDHVYILDSNNHRVRKILTNGTIITIAGEELKKNKQNTPSRALPLSIHLLH